MKHIIIGTAGHIDHGKTTLIKALTGNALSQSGGGTEKRDYH